MKINEYTDLEKFSGIYLLYNRETRITKIGRAVNIRDRISQYNNTLTPWGVVPDVMVWYCDDVKKKEEDVLKGLSSLKVISGTEYFECDDISFVSEVITSVVGNSQHIYKENKISNNDLRVWRCLIHYAKDSVCDIRQQQLADFTNMSLTTAKRSLYRLCRLGKIRKVETRTVGYCAAISYVVLSRP